MSGTAVLAEVVELIACESWDVLKNQAHAVHIRFVTTPILQKDLRRTLAVLQDHGLRVCMGAQAHPPVPVFAETRVYEDWAPRAPIPAQHDIVGLDVIEDHAALVHTVQTLSQLYREGRPVWSWVAGGAGPEGIQQTFQCQGVRGPGFSVGHHTLNDGQTLVTPGFLQDYQTITMRRCVCAIQRRK